MKASLVNTRSKMKTCHVRGERENHASVDQITGLIDGAHCLIYAKSFEAL